MIGSKSRFSFTRIHTVRMAAGCAVSMFFCFLTVSGIRGQVPDSLGIASTAAQEVLIPPLEVLIDSALQNDPTLHYQDLQTLSNEYKLRLSRTEWAKNLGFQSDIRYGTFDNFSTNTGDGQSPSILATKSSQTNYGVGVFLKVPIDALVNHKSQVNLAKNALEQAESMAEAQRREIRQLVILRYQDLLLKQRLLEIKSRNVYSSRINMNLVEKQFRSRQLDAAEYSRVAEIAGRSEAEYEAARTDYITAYMILEEIVGFKFK